MKCRGAVALSKSPAEKQTQGPFNERVAGQVLELVKDRQVLLGD